MAGTNSSTNFGPTNFGYNYEPDANSIQQLTMLDTSSSAAGLQSANTTGQNPTALGQSVMGEPALVWIGMIAFLIALKWLSERKNNNPLNPADIRISGYNVLAVTVIAATGFILLKVIFNTVNIPGLTAFVNAT